MADSHWVSRSLHGTTTMVTFMLLACSKGLTMFSMICCMVGLLGTCHTTSSICWPLPAAVGAAVAAAALVGAVVADADVAAGALVGAAVVGWGTWVAGAHAPSTNVDAIKSATPLTKADFPNRVATAILLDTVSVGCRSCRFLTIAVNAWGWLPPSGPCTVESFHRFHLLLPGRGQHRPPANSHSGPTAG